MNRVRHLDIQTKISLVLVAVIVPTFLLVTVAQYQLARPILEAEWKQIGITTAESVASKIVSNRWFHKITATSNPIDDELQVQIYRQPSILRMDVFAKDHSTSTFTKQASTMTGEPVEASSFPAPVDTVTSEFRTDEDGDSYFDIRVPIQTPGATARAAARTIGMVHVLISNKAVTRLMENYWKITGVAAAISVVLLILFLSYFLRRAIGNEKLLRQTQTQNLQLSQQLHEAHRQLMNVEKLAVMGQLTANFAHEIGTPLNAISGHLQLLQEEVAGEARLKRSIERVEIISGELQRIEDIVKGFLQTTSKPESQPQLVEINGLIDRTLDILRPRIDSMGVRTDVVLDRSMGPLRVVPVDIEQILMNLINNSLDSLQSKRTVQERLRPALKITTQSFRAKGAEWAEIRVQDNGLGIPKNDLKRVLKPFYTTKLPGEGTGLGLTICEQLASKYAGVLEIESKEGAWAEVKLKIPYRLAA